MPKPINPINETTNDARVLARQLIRTARFGAIGVLQEDGSPLVTRILVATDSAGNPIILISELSEHTKAITRNNKVSLLLGEPKKGDPVAYPRISLQGEATIVPRQNEHYARDRTRFIRRHPKSELYIGFADFQIFRIKTKSANLNGGFGKAFQLEPSDFLSEDTSISSIEQETLDLINNRHSDIISNFSTEKMGWKMISLDCDGFELANGDNIIRREFKVRMKNVNDPTQVIKFLTNKKNIE